MLKRIAEGVAKNIDFVLGPTVRIEGWWIENADRSLTLRLMRRCPDRETVVLDRVFHEFQLKMQGEGSSIEWISGYLIRTYTDFLLNASFDQRKEQCTLNQFPKNSSPSQTSSLVGPVATQQPASTRLLPSAK